MKTLLIAARAIVYMTGFFYVFGWLAFRARTFDPQIAFQLPAWLEVPGLILAFPAAALGLFCAGAFIIRGRGTPAPFDAPREFVAAGPYRWVRNPMYVGGLSFLACLACYLHSISILLMTLFLFGVVHAFVLFYEEPTLRRQFGATYEEYCRNVHRWLPRSPRATHSHGSQTVR
jgi:protein-S-isoprenylcysteine O-methyltransferase Ste14